MVKKQQETDASPEADSDNKTAKEHKFLAGLSLTGFALNVLLFFKPVWDPFCSLLATITGRKINDPGIDAVAQIASAGGAAFDGKKAIEHLKAAHDIETTEQTSAAKAQESEKVGRSKPAGEYPAPEQYTHGVPSSKMVNEKQPVLARS